MAFTVLLLLTSTLLVIGLFAFTLTIYLLSTLLKQYRSIKSIRPIWRNKYPSFEELHALFDRGDIMFSAVLIASSLQLAHPRIGKYLAVHSSYHSDPWRRIIRTMTFIYILIRSSSSERMGVIKWLQGLHKNIPLFVFENNVLAFATFAYGLAKSHEFLGNATPEEVDVIVKAVMSMADKLDPKDRGRKVPDTMAEVEDYIRAEIVLDGDMLKRINTENANRCVLRQELQKYGLKEFLKHPLAFIKLSLLKRFVRSLSNNVLTQDDLSNRSLLYRAFWYLTRKTHCFLSYFHYSMCPTDLTFDGTLFLLATGNPCMSSVPLDMYREIFGSKLSSANQPFGSGTLRRFTDMQAHLPRMDIDNRPMPQVLNFRTELIELIKCSFHRGTLAASVGHPPRHLGVIMDGNRRYSRSRGLDSVLAGHQVGAHKLLQVMSWAFSSGVQNLTVWALSDDNLKRGPGELNPLFEMMAEYIKEMMMGDAPFSIPDVRLRVVGDRSILPEYLQEIIDNAEQKTAQNTKFNLQIAIGYGGRAEVTRATKMAVNEKMTVEGMTLEEAVEKVGEKDISRQTYSAQCGLPQIDAILRTSGENRLSGFALWETQHAEFAIVKENWPELGQSTFLGSLVDLSGRKRRFGA